MYNLTKMTPAAAAFVNKAMGSGLNRSEFFPIGLGYLIAANLSLPPQEVTSVDEYYRNTHQGAVMELVGVVTEMLPHVSKQSLEMTKKFFAFRVAAAYPKQIPLAMKPCGGVVDFFGLSGIFDETLLKSIECSEGKLTSIISGLYNVMEAIRSNQVSRSEQMNSSGTEDNYVA